MNHEQFQQRLSVAYGEGTMLIIYLGMFLLAGIAAGVFLRIGPTPLIRGSHFLVIAIFVSATAVFGIALLIVQAANQLFGIRCLFRFAAIRQALAFPAALATLAVGIILDVLQLDGGTLKRNRRFWCLSPERIEYFLATWAYRTADSPMSEAVSVHAQRAVITRTVADGLQEMSWLSGMLFGNGQEPSGCMGNRLGPGAPAR